MSSSKDDILDLESIARKNLGRIRRNLTTAMLYEEILRNREGHLAHLGPVVVRTGQYTERSVTDRFWVDPPQDCAAVLVEGDMRPMDSDRFDALLSRMLSYMRHKDIYVQDCQAGADPKRRVSLRVVTENAWHSLFVRNMYIQIHNTRILEGHKPEMTVVHVPGFTAVPNRDGTSSTSFMVINPRQKLMLLGGTGYAGALRQAVATCVNALHPAREVLPLRCAVNLGADGTAAMFMGRTGTGKTTLATDPERRLLGDHLHGWTDSGLFNYEWGCYPRVWNLSADDEPLIHDCTRRFGTVLENVGLDPDTRRVDLSDGTLTENTRAAYPIAHIPNAERDGMCGHPAHVFMLTRDPFGVLPPIARLDTDQAVFAFLLSFLSSLNERETGFRAPGVTAHTAASGSALSMKPFDYAKLFMSKIARHGARCWFMNTGWSGEPHDRGPRNALAHSRTLVRAAVSGQLDQVQFEKDPLFMFEIPLMCPGVPAEFLNPRARAVDETEYELRANRLALDLIQAFSPFGERMPASIRQMVANVPVLPDAPDLMEQLDISI